MLDDGKIKNTSFDTSLGFGFRAVHEDKTAFCHSNIISKKSLEDASQNLKSNIKSNSQRGKQNNPKRTNKKLYEDIDPIENKPFAEKVELLKRIDNYIRRKNPNIKQVTASFFGEHQSIEIIKSDNQIYKDQKVALKKDFEAGLKTNDFWLSSILKAIKYNQNIEKVTYLKSIVDSITLNEIANLAKQLLDDQYFESVSYLSE